MGKLHQALGAIFLLGQSIAIGQAAESLSGTNYFAVGYVTHSIDNKRNTENSSSIDVNGFELTAGHNFSSAFAGEFQLGFLEYDSFEIPFDDDEIEVSETSIQTTKLSLLYRPNLGLRAKLNKAKPFIRFGVVEGDLDTVKATYRGRAINVNVENGSGDVLGLGFDLESGSSTFRFEIIRMFKNEDFGLTLSFLF